MAGYIDGLYKGSSRGIGGQVNVSIIVEGGAVTDCALTRCKETSGIGAEAGPMMANAIRDAGGTDGVETIAGSTVTSRAVLDAANQALAAATLGYNDGAYEGTARGIGGRVDVRATFKGGELAAFELTRNKETNGIGFQAAPIVAKAIADAGTYEGVDVVGGATVSSRAVLEAARDAFDAASGSTFYEAYLQEQAAIAAADSKGGK